MAAAPEQGRDSARECTSVEKEKIVSIAEGTSLERKTVPDGARGQVGTEILTRLLNKVLKSFRLRMRVLYIYIQPRTVMYRY